MRLIASVVLKSKCPVLRSSGRSVKGGTIFKPQLTREQSGEASLCQPPVSNTKLSAICDNKDSYTTLYAFRAKYMRGESGNLLGLLSVIFLYELQVRYREPSMVSAHDRPPGVRDSEVG